MKQTRSILSHDVFCFKDFQRLNWLLKVDMKLWLL